jgi:hypothetical protein
VRLELEGLLPEDQRLVNLVVKATTRALTPRGGALELDSDGAWQLQAWLAGFTAPRERHLAAITIERLAGQLAAAKQHGAAKRLLALRLRA